MGFCRSQLLAVKQVIQQPISPVHVPLKEQLKQELSRYLGLLLLLYKSYYKYSRFLLLRGTMDPKDNPNVWWRSHQNQFPLLAKYWRANCAFPATSTSSDRPFSMDGLIISTNRFIYYIFIFLDI